MFTRTNDSTEFPYTQGTLIKTDNKNWRATIPTLKASHKHWIEHIFPAKLFVFFTLIPLQKQSIGVCTLYSPRLTHPFLALYLPDTINFSQRLDQIGRKLLWSYRDRIQGITTCTVLRYEISTPLKNCGYFISRVLSILIAFI